MISLKNIKKTFKDSHNNDVIILNDLNINFPSKGLICIVGKSGSGKTTLLNILSGIIKPDAGEYFLFNNDTSDFHENDWCNIRGKYFSYIFQSYNLLEKATLYENIKLVTIKNDIQITDDEIDTLLKKYDIYDLKDKPVYELSGGEAQRCAIVRSVITNSKVVLADEPTGALDKENAINVFKSLQELGKEKLVIVVTHDTDFAEEYADGIVKLAYGEIESSTIVESDEIYSEEITYDSSFSMKKTKEFGKIILKKNKRKQILSISLCSLFIAMITFLLNFIFFNPTEYAFQSIMDNDPRVFLPSFIGIENSTKKEADLITEDIVEEYNLNIGFVDLIYRCCLNDKVIFGKDLGSIIIDDNLGENEIILTDYVLNQLNEKYDYNFVDFADMAGGTIDFSGRKFVVKEIKILGNDFLNDGDYVSTTCNVTYMNSETARKLISIYDVIQIDKYKYYSYSSLLGSASDIVLNGNEVILSISEIDSFFGITPDQWSSINYFDYVGQEIQLKINGITSTYMIKGYISEAYKVVFSDELFDEIFSLSSIDLNEYDHFYWTYINDYKQYISLLNFCNDNFNSNYKIVRSGSNEIKEFDILYDVLFNANAKLIECNISFTNGSFKTLSYFLCGIFLFVLIIVLLLVDKFYLSINKKSIGVLYFLGYDKKKVSICYHGNNLDITLISTTIGIAMSFIFFPIYSAYVNSSILFERNITVMLPTWYVYIIAFAVSLLLSVAIMFISIKKELKFKLLNLIKGE